MSFSEGCVGGVEPETVTRLWQHKQSRLLTYIEPVSGLGRRHTADQWREWGDFVPLSALRLVEEELRQAREERDRLVRLFRDVAREAEEGFSVAASRIGSTASQALVGYCAACNRKPCQTPDVCRRKSLTVMAKAKGRTMGEVIEQAKAVEEELAALSPVQGEHEQDGEACGGCEMSPPDHADWCPMKAQDGEDGENTAVWRGEPVFVGDKNFAQWLKEHQASHARMGITTPCVCAGCEWARAQDGDTEETT